MKISVITVCYNEEKNIAATIESVLCQTATDFEYIICDGKSKDRTVEIAESYIEKFKERNIDYRVYSEKDSGIYFGMNNGIDRATGDYVIFTNAGDKLNDANVISEILNGLGDKNPEVVYGDCLYVDRGLGFIVCGDHTKLEEYMSISHPATLVRSDIIKSNKFNTSYKIAADYNMMLSLYTQKFEFFHLDLVVSKFYMDGVSSVRMVESIKEAAKLRESYGIKVNLEEELVIVERNEKRNKFKRAMPKFLWKLWNKNIKKRMWIED